MTKNTATIQVARPHFERTNAVVLAETVIRKIAEVSGCIASNYTYSLSVPELLEGGDMLITVEDTTGFVVLQEWMADQSRPDNALIRAHHGKLQKMVEALAKIIDMKVMLVLRTSTTTFSVTSA